LGARRSEARAETQCIEARLRVLLEQRGFKVVSNWIPPVGPDGNAGEVDVICARDGTVLVLEVKSTRAPHHPPCAILPCMRPGALPVTHCRTPRALSRGRRRTVDGLRKKEKA
jgi:hypothetical protein